MRLPLPLMSTPVNISRPNREPRTLVRTDRSVRGSVRRPSERFRTRLGPKFTWISSSGRLGSKQSKVRIYPQPNPNCSSPKAQLAYHDNQLIQKPSVFSKVGLRNYPFSKSTSAVWNRKELDYKLRLKTMTWQSNFIKLISSSSRVNSSTFYKPIVRWSRRIQNKPSVITSSPWLSNDPYVEN